MKWCNKTFISIIICCLCMALVGCGSATSGGGDKPLYSVVDDYGVQVDFTSKPTRILTFAMSSDSIVMGLVGTERLVAVNNLADDPNSSNIVAQAQTIQHKIMDPRLEEVVSLNSELVIVYDWVKVEMINNLRDLGIKVVQLKRPSSMAGIRSNVAKIADALGEHRKGEEMLAMMDAKLAEIKNKLEVGRFKNSKTIVLKSLMPTYGGIGSVFDSICQEAGVINGVAAVGIRQGQEVTKEMLVKINPDMLLLPSYRGKGAFDVDAYNQQFLQDAALQTVKAVSTRSFAYPREGYIYNASQDVVFGVQELAYVVYGDQFAQPADNHISVFDN